MGYDRQPNGSELIAFSIADPSTVVAGKVAGKGPFRYLKSLLRRLRNAFMRRPRYELVVARARTHFATIAERFQVRCLMKLRVNQFDVNYTVHDDPPIVRVTMVYDREDMVGASRHYIGGLPSH